MTYTTTEFARLSWLDAYYLRHNLRRGLTVEEQANWRLVQHQLAHMAWRAWDEAASAVPAIGAGQAMGAERARAKGARGQ